MRVGTAYGRAVYITMPQSEVAEPGTLSTAGTAERAGMAFIWAARNHYAPIIGLCKPGLLTRLNACCRLTAWDPEDPQGRLLRSSILLEITALRHLRTEYKKHPLTADDLAALRAAYQKYRLAPDRPFAGISGITLRLEYPSFAAVNWRIGTLRKWPPCLAMDWQSGLDTMQIVAAGRRILSTNRSLSQSKPSTLRLVPLLTGRRIALHQVDRANRILARASSILYKRILLDIASKNITLSRGIDRSRITPALRATLVGWRNAGASVATH